MRDRLKAWLSSRFTRNVLWMQLGAASHVGLSHDGGIPEGLFDLAGRVALVIVLVGLAALLTTLWIALARATVAVAPTDGGGANG